MNHIPQIFNESFIHQHKNKSHHYFNYDGFFHQAVCRDMFERLSFINKDFETVILLNCPPFIFESAGGHDFIKQKNIQNIIHISHFPNIYPENTPVIHIENNHLNLDIKSCDLFLAPLSLHYINDLPGILKQIFHIIRDDGVFMANMIGEHILGYFHHIFSETELNITGGMHTRIHPALDIRMMGDLLMRAGFTLPVSDVSVFPIVYNKIMSLFKDLKSMGERRGLSSMTTPIRRDVFNNVLERLKTDLMAQDKKYHLDVDIITIIGRSPSDLQQQPLARGSAKIGLDTGLKIIHNYTDSENK